MSPSRTSKPHSFSTPDVHASRRPYQLLRARLAPLGTRDDRMQSLVDAGWDMLAPTGVSWIGFYIKPASADELVLAARRDKPACSPIGFHGACGQSFRAARALVVTDVAKLGAGYIACDPRDRSEVVVPLFEADPAAHSKIRVWGVLDVDSHETDAFTADDAHQLHALLIACGLSCGGEIGVDLV